jgi:hypothetical protein
MLRVTLISVVISLFILMGCDNDETNGPSPPGGLHKIQLSFQGVEPLKNGYHYEGWAIINGQPVSTGKFNIDAGGNLVDLNNTTIPNGEFDVTEDLSNTAAVVITIEPQGDSDPIPAETHYLAGPVNNTASSLTVGDPAALGDDYASASGSYILATPTDGPNTNENSGIWFLNPPSTTFRMNFNGLEPLKNGYHYEGWAIVNSAAVSTGKFNIDAGGNLVDPDGNTIPNGDFTVPGDQSVATAIVLTIEPDNDPDPAPAETHYLAGDVSGNSATLTIGHGAALGDDFSSAGGNYILATPTNGDNTEENSGIWFLDLTSGSPQPGLSLPILPAGWEYEGWAVINGTPVTTGRFTDPAAADNAAPYSGSQPGPPFPGEDFLMNAPAGLTFPTDLAGATAVISIEPSPDDDPAPFTLKPLAGMIPANAVDHVTYSMDNNSAGVPGGSVTITLNAPAAALQLSALPPGWEYEGWVVINSMPVTTGKFSDVSAADDAAPYSGAQAGPPFPGEDFLQNAPSGLTFPTDIANGTAVISIEPFPDDDPAPFTLKPLAGQIPANATDHVSYPIDNNTVGFPNGSATIQ